MLSESERDKMILRLQAYGGQRDPDKADETEPDGEETFERGFHCGREWAICEASPDELTRLEEYETSGGNGVFRPEPTRQWLRRGADGMFGAIGEFCKKNGANAADFQHELYGPAFRQVFRDGFVSGALMAWRSCHDGGVFYPQANDGTGETWDKRATKRYWPDE